MSKQFILCILAYLMGSIPTGIIISKKFSNIDIQSEGSGNIGATNVARLLGKKFGALTLLGDIIKGCVPVVLALWLIGTGNLKADVRISLVALFAVVGHMYPIFLGFRGGKGIATSAGVFLVLSPLAVLADILIFLLVLIKWRIVSLGSLCAALCMPVLVALFTDSKIFILLAVTIAALIFFRHRENIEKLLHGEEKRWGTPKAS